MKKLLLLLLVLPFVFASCSSDDDEDINKTIDIEIKVGETYSLPNGVYSIITPPNSFIATINDNGEIKGVHDGSTIVKVKSGTSIYDCKISVSANTTLYVDCAVYLGLKKADIVKIYGNPTHIDKQIYFFKGMLYEKQLLFTFDDNDIVIAAGIEFTVQYAKLVGEHLADRYAYLGVSDGIIMYLNTYDINDKKAIAVLVTNSSSVISIIYVKRTDTNANKSAFSASIE